MAMNKKPKPLRPSGPTKPVTKYTIGVPKKPVVKITKVTKPLKKATVKNPSAPSASSPRGGGVRVITKSETFMKKDKARSTKMGTLPLTKTVTDSMKTAGKKSYKPSTGNQKLIEGTQTIRGKGYTPLTAAEKRAANEKNKSKGVTPKKKAEAPKKAAPKRRLFVGRGGRSGGGMLGGGGAMNDYNR
jgi:hypothetical protein